MKPASKTLQAPALHELQSWMAWALTRPEGVSAALENQETSQEPTRQLQSIVSDAKMGSIDRLNIYANAYFSRLKEVLDEDYATLKYLMGEDEFLDLAAEYLQECPSTYPNISLASKKLPQFLSETLWDDSNPEFTDMARLEWAVMECVFLNRIQATASEQLQTLKPEEMASIQFILDPTLHFIDVSHNVEKIWLEREDLIAEGQTPEFQKTSTHLAVRRFENGHVGFVRFQHDEKILIDWIRSGLNLSEMAAEIAEKGMNPELMKSFGNWVQNGVIVQIGMGQNDLGQGT